MNFQKNCYEILKKVPKGKVTTYKEIAKALNTKAYRAVGTAMNKNPNSFCDGGDVPCHRVINSNGNVGKFAKGKKEKIRLLEKEGIEIKEDKIDLKKYLYKFNYSS